MYYNVLPAHLNSSPMATELKSVELEFKALDSAKRTGVIAHAVYNSIDENDDISTPGMFKKSWAENKSVDFLFNHKQDAIVGTVTGLYDDEEKAYTAVSFGKWKLGDDVMEMADAGVLRGASFGFVTQRKEFKEVKGRKIRVLKQVYHGETSLLTKKPAHPKAGLITMTKAFEGLELKKLSQPEVAMLKQIVANDHNALQALVDFSSKLDVTSDLYTWINWNISRRAEMIGTLRDQLKYNSGEIKAIADHVKIMEDFCRNAKASDDCIKAIESEIAEAKSLLSSFDTLDTHPAGAQSSSNGNDREAFRRKLLLLTMQDN